VTPSEVPIFTHELLIRATPNQKHILETRLEVARLAYNALLGESLRRAQLLRESREFRKARVQRAGRRRRAALRRVDERFGFRRYDLYAWASEKITPTWLGGHIDAQCVRSLAARAFTAARQFQLGRKGLPRSLRPGQLRSVEGQSDRQGIRISGGEFIWRDLRAELEIDSSDPHTIHALRSRVRRVRLVKRKIGTKICFYAVLVCGGTPYFKPRAPLGQQTVGVDPGPRFFGIAFASEGAVVDLSSSGGNRSRNRRAERSASRKLRLGNPANFECDGNWRPKPKFWRRSNHLRREMAWIAQFRRRAAAERKTLRGTLVNALLRAGTNFKVEANAYRQFHKQFGRSAKQAAPGSFTALLRRRCRELRISFAEVPRSLRLSRTCHNCGRVQPKGLALRVHDCPCGVIVQRDIYSAWLARFAIVDPPGSSWILDIDQAKKAWSGAGLRLPAISGPLSIHEFVSFLENQVASDRLAISPPSIGGTERLAGAMVGTSDDARDVVGLAEGPRKSDGKPSRGSSQLGPSRGGPVHGNDERRRKRSIAAEVGSPAHTAGRRQPRVHQRVKA